MLASTWFDLVIGVDLHFELVPPPMVPTPFPHPFVGLVFDPIGLAASVAISNAIGMAMGDSFKGPVLINGLPANTTGTEAKNAFILPHFIIPPGTVWAPMVRVPKPAIIPGKAPELELPIPPPGDAVMITGSKTVHAMGANLCRLGDLALSCSDPVRLPSSAVLAIPKGPPVLVGGPPAVDWMAAGFGFIKCKWVASRLHTLVSRIKNARVRSFLHKTVCFFTGHPVDVATGRVLTEAVDFELPGPLPLKFERTYDSSLSFRDSPLGYGWSHSLDQAVWIEPGCVVYRAEDGREIEFDTFDLPDHVIRPGEEIFEPVNRLTLRSLGQYRWEIETPEGIVHELAPVPGDADRTQARLLKKRSRNGHTIELHYDGKARLEWVRDCAGRLIRFDHDESGKLVKVSLPHPSQAGWVPHTRYEYSAEGDLVEVYDPLKHVAVFEYAGHLLVRETDRTGVSFYFGYDGIGSSAYCIRTWGDGGIYDHAIDYDKQGRVTYVTDSLGATTTYEMNVANAVLKVIDALGGMTRYEYDDNLWKTAEIDQLGYITRYEHDARGNCTKMTTPDGSAVRVEFNELNRPALGFDACGGEWRWNYDLWGQLIERVNPLGERARYEYKDGQLSAIIDALGARYSFTYDRAKNVRCVRAPNGAEARFEHDTLGRVIERRSPRGQIQRTRYDACSRPVGIEEPHGNVRRIAYDASGNITELQDHDRRIRIHYTGFHKPSLRDDSGVKTRFRYDTEGRLLEVENDAGESYRFIHDACGRIREEIAFDGQPWRYERDDAGRPVKVHKPSGATTALIYDGVGRLIELAHSDGTVEKFYYREDGALLEVANETATVRFDRDVLGRVIREWQGNHWIESQYDGNGKRTRAASSLGISQAMTRGITGEVETLSIRTGATLWSAEFMRDEIGLEIERRMPGGVAISWHRDQYGRPLERKIARDSGNLEFTRYEWGSDLQLLALTDSRSGRTVFEYDKRQRVVAVQHEDGSVEYRAPDPLGNVYPRRERVSRRYGTGGRLVEAEGEQFIYDADGNLVETVLCDGSRWRYAYSGMGMLKEVERPDGVKVTFSYDGLGRRVRKVIGSEQTTWTWDGHVPLHELSGHEGTVTWLFEPESFTPVGKLSGNRCFGVVPDHLGTPTALYDESGALSWSAQLDIHGRAKKRVESTSCPWRFPGQYEDIETGLHYNGLRYYDPRTGRYISRDPLTPLGAMNPYSYVQNPLSAIDPLGLVDPWDIWFTQDSIDNKFLHGPWEGRPLREAIEEATQLGKLPEGLELKVMELGWADADGNYHLEYVTLSNRTLYVARAAGLHNVPITNIGAKGQNQLDKLLDGKTPQWENPKVRGCRGS